MRDAIQAAHGRTVQRAERRRALPDVGNLRRLGLLPHFLDDRQGQGAGLHDRVGTAAGVVRKSFHPDYADMVPIIEEVTAALLAFCAALGVPSRAAALGISSDASRQTDQTG